MGVWGGDGRITAGHLAALPRWTGSGLLITLMGRPTDAPPNRVVENAEKMTRRRWTERDTAMAGRVLAAPYAAGGQLVVAGKLHTQLRPLPAGDPMGAQLARQLARQRPGLCSIECIYGRGRFYNLGPRRHPDGLRGLRLEAPLLIQQDGAFLLQVPSPGEATVPHRQPAMRSGNATAK